MSSEKRAAKTSAGKSKLSLPQTLKQTLMCHNETVFKRSCRQLPVVSADQKQTIQGFPEKFVIQMREMFEEAKQLCVWRGSVLSHTG